VSILGGSGRGKEEAAGPRPVHDIWKTLSTRPHDHLSSPAMIRKLKDGSYRLYSRKKNPKTGKRRNLGTFKTREAARKHERAVQYFKRH
jgi:hypothetical protein